MLEWNNTLTDRANTRLKSLVAQVNAQQLEKLQNRIEKWWQEVESPIREKRAKQKQLIEEARARVVEGSIRMSEWLEMKFDETQTESLSRDIKQEWTQWVRETKKALLESNEPEFLQEFQRELDQHLNQMLNSHVQQALQDERIAAENVYKASADQVISKLAHVNQATSECMDKEEASAGIFSTMQSYMTLASNVSLVNYATRHTAQIVYSFDLTSPTYLPKHQDAYLWNYLISSRWLYNIFHAVGLQTVTSFPPEQILSGSSVIDSTVILAPPVLGSCWPMQGIKGQVTIRFSEPIDIHSVVINHAAPLNGGASNHSSAIRYFKLVGYPPCNAANQHDNDYCILLGGIDISNLVDLGEYEYTNLHQQNNSTSPIWQAFRIKSLSEPHHIEHHARHGQEEADLLEEPEQYVLADKVDDDDCDAPTSTQCSSPPSEWVRQNEPPKKSSVDEPKKHLFQALTLVVEDNWGHDEYTCIYGISILGYPIE